jgi:hypothetical protein
MRSHSGRAFFPRRTRRFRSLPTLAFGSVFPVMMVAWQPAGPSAAKPDWPGDLRSARPECRITAFSAVCAAGAGMNGG